MWCSSFIFFLLHFLNLFCIIWHLFLYFSIHFMHFFWISLHVLIVFAQFFILYLLFVQYFVFYFIRCFTFFCNFWIILHFSEFSFKLFTGKKVLNFFRQKTPHSVSPGLANSQFKTVKLLFFLPLIFLDRKYILIAFYFYLI